MDQSGVRRAKAARIEVEGCQLCVEVDVQPLAPCGLAWYAAKWTLRRPMPLRWCAPCVLVSMRKAWSPPSDTTLTKPMRCPSASRAVTQPRLCGRIRSHQPTSALPPWASTSSTISASVNGPRQRYVTPSERNCCRRAGEAKRDQSIQPLVAHLGGLPHVSAVLVDKTITCP